MMLCRVVRGAGSICLMGGVMGGFNFQTYSKFLFAIRDVVQLMLLVFARYPSPLLLFVPRDACGEIKSAGTILPLPAQEPAWG